jgi:glycosyltransferase involved in cell wall biosynthesis
VRAQVPKVARRVAAILARQRPGAVITNSLAMTLIARAAQPGRRAPVINVAHGWPADRYRLVAPLMRAADVVVAVSPDVKEQLVRHGLPESRCEVVFNGVDCRGLGPRSGDARAAAREAMGAGPADILVVSMGRLTTQKAHQHVVTVAGALRGAQPGLRYAIIGEGARAEELTQLVRAAGLETTVRLMGLRSDTADLLGAADIFLLCSDWEGMPLSTIEAMASGLPTVATRTQGADQLLTPSCGIVVPVGDAAAMAEGVARLAVDPALRASMGAVARERALTHFSHDRMVRELSEIVARVAL